MRCDWNLAKTQFGIVLEYFQSMIDAKTQFGIVLAKTQFGRQNLS